MRSCATSPRGRRVQRTEHGQRPVSRGEAGLFVLVTDLAVTGDHRGAVDGAEAEFRHA